MMKKYLLTISIATIIAVLSIIAGGFYGLTVTLILTLPATIFALEEIKEEAKNNIPIWLYLKTTNNKDED